MTEAEGLTPPVKWGQVGRAVTLGGQSDRSAGCLRSALNSNMAAVFKQHAAEGRGWRGAWEGGVEPRPSFSSSFAERTEVPF